MSNVKKQKKDNTLLNILFNWKEKGIIEGRFAVYTSIYETSKGKYKMDEKIYISLISDSLGIKEFFEKGSAIPVNEEFLQNPFALQLLLLKLFDGNLGREIVAIIMDVDKEKLYPNYELILETLFYPHRVEDKIFTVCKEFLFAFTEAGLILAPFIQSSIQIDM